MAEATFALSMTIDQCMGLVTNRAQSENNGKRHSTVEGIGEKPSAKSPLFKKMRRSCGNLETLASCEGEDSLVNVDHSNGNAIDMNSTSHDREHRNDESVEDEPDWEKLSENEPAALEQVELFLKARETRDEADERFSIVMDECNTAMENAKKQLLQAAADMHNLHREELDYLESDIKQTLVWNHQVSSKMKRDLEDTQARAQGLFSQLLMTVSQPLGFLTGVRQTPRDE